MLLSSMSKIRSVAFRNVAESTGGTAARQHPTRFWMTFWRCFGPS